MRIGRELLATALATLVLALLLLLPTSALASSSSLTLQPGWNLVAAAPGTTFPSTLFGWNGTSYVSTPTPVAWQGYWCNVSHQESVSLATVYGPYSTSLATGWNLVGNPMSYPATLTLPAGRVAFIYDASAHTYVSTLTLTPGQGAWVRGEAGESVTLSPPAPTITALSPTSGPASGDTSVIITGAAFMGVTEVSFGGTAIPPSDYTVDSDTQITATAPAHTAGAVRVQVTAAGGSTADTFADDYTYLDITTTIAVNDFANYRVFQRDIGSTSKSVTVGGTYSNMDWSRVEARVLRHGTDTPVVDWQTIDSTFGGGTFSGSLTVPQGGWYNIEVRAQDGTGAVLGTSRGTNRWGVGMIILVIGQSNMSGRGQTPFATVTSDLAVNYSNAGSWEHLADPYDDESPPGAVDEDVSAGGSMIPGIANSLLQTFDFPIAFVPAAKGGSNLYSQWSYRNSSNHFDTSTLYGQSITKAQQVGGVELIIMHQGEADLSDGRTEANYEADFATMMGHYRQDLHSTIPIFICQLGTVGAGTDARAGGIRNAQHDVDNGTSTFMGATAMDLPRMDTWHYTTPALTVIGSRLATAIKYYYGQSTYYRGPSIDSAFFSDTNRNQVRATLNHRGGTDITPTTGITGFQVFDNGASVTIGSAVRYSSNAVLLTFSRSIAAGHTVTLRYLYGMTPNVSGLVKDNSPLALPLENATDDITVADLPPNSLPVAVDDTYGADEDIILSVDAPGLLGNDRDDDQDPLTAALVSSVSHGSLTLNADGSFSYTPAAGYTGSDSFTYSASDGQAASNTASVSITVISGGNFTFAVTADMQQHAGSGANDSSLFFRGVCEKIATLDESVFMVSPGDLDPPVNVDWTVNQYLGQDYLWYPAAGNHDEETPSEMTWLRTYDYDPNGTAPPHIVNAGPPNCVGTTYSFDYGNGHFVVLNEYYNGSSDTGTDGDVVDALYDWLLADLSATDKPHIFVFGHEPAYPQPDADNGVLRHLGDSLDKYPAHRDRFWALLEDFHVVAYVCGHTHAFSAVQINGVWQVNTGHSQGIGDTGTRSTFVMIHIDENTVTFDTYRDNYNGGPYLLTTSGTLSTPE